jgi:hypothetical protein
MQNYLAKNASGRKQRLFACARWRQVWHLLTADRRRPVLEMAERVADGLATVSELEPVALVDRWVAAITAPGLRRVAAKFADGQRGRFYDTFLDVEIDGVNEAVLIAAWKIQPALIRDILGNPFRTVSIDPAWLTPTVTDLATVAYNERALPSGELDPARLAILGDALEEAGCGNAVFLSHLRSPGPHVRGCWAVDLLLGKE